MAVFGIDPNQLVDDEGFIHNQLATSALVSHIGNVVADDSITTDNVFGISIVVDTSNSMSVVAQAVRNGYKTMVETLSKTSERGKMFLQVVTFSNEVHEVHPFTRLVSAQDNRTLQVPLLNESNYNPKTGSLTGTVPALQKVVADNRLFEAVCGLDDVDVNSSHIIILITDGFANRGPADAVQQYRRFVSNRRREENWKFLQFSLIDSYTKDTFYREFMAQVRKANVSWTGGPDDAAKVMFEAMGTGWGYYAESESEIQAISNLNAKSQAELYFLAEGIIMRMMPNYRAIGGLGYNPNDILTVDQDPERVLDLIGAKVSQSIINASQTAVNGGGVAASGIQTGGSVF